MRIVDRVKISENAKSDYEDLFSQSIIPCERCPNPCGDKWVKDCINDKYSPKVPKQYVEELEYYIRFNQSIKGKTQFVVRYFDETLNETLVLFVHKGKLVRHEQSWRLVGIMPEYVYSEDDDDEGMYKIEFDTNVDFILDPYDWVKVRKVIVKLISVEDEIEEAKTYEYDCKEELSYEKHIYDLEHEVIKPDKPDETAFKRAYAKLAEATSFRKRLQKRRRKFRNRLRWLQGKARVCR